MLKVDIEKMRYEISGTMPQNQAEFAYLTVELINRYGIKNVKKAFNYGCNESIKEDSRNGRHIYSAGTVTAYAKY